MIILALYFIVRIFLRDVYLYHILRLNCRSIKDLILKTHTDLDTHWRTNVSVDLGVSPLQSCPGVKVNILEGVTFCVSIQRLSDKLARHFNCFIITIWLITGKIYRDGSQNLLGACQFSFESKVLIRHTSGEF